jgi:hypothetical protein
MIEYDRIGSQAIDVLMSDKNDDWSRISDRQETFAFFQYRLNEWGKRISTDFQFLSNDDETDMWNQQLRTLLHLRENHLRIIVARSFICDNRHSAAPLDIWAYSVDAAADSIQLLSRLDSSTKTYRFHQSQYNYFLIAALGTLLLAVTPESSNPGLISLREQRIPMAPATYLKAQQNSMLVLNLLYTSAKSSRHSQCLWDRVRGLARRLNLLDRLVPGSSCTEASGLENEAPARHVRSADVTMGLIRSAEPYVFGGVDMISPGLQDLAISPWNKAPSPSGLDATQDLGVLIDGSLANDQCWESTTSVYGVVFQDIITTTVQ